MDLTTCSLLSIAKGFLAAMLGQIINYNRNQPSIINDGKVYNHQKVICGEVPKIGLVTDRFLDGSFGISTLRPMPSNTPE